MDIGRYLDNIDKKFTRKDKTKMKQYDYLIVGSGLYGAVFAQQATAKGKRVLVIDKRPNIAGNVYTEDIEKIHVHKYGAHIFHTNNKKVWNYITKFAEFNRFTNSPVANYKGELYSLPFNMYTFNKMWGVITPQEAADKIEEQKKEAGITEPKNLEEQAISLVGTDIYEKLIKGYTEKQWGRPCTELPSFIIKRLPVRLTFDNNYFNALYQGIPVGGYTKMIANMLGDVEVRLNTDYFEHKWFEFGKDEEGNDLPKTVISREYSSEWKLGDEPYYPVNDEKNGKLYEEYKKLAEKEKNIIFGGRLGEYKYYDMDAVIAAALDMCEKEL